MFANSMAVVKELTCCSKGRSSQLVEVTSVGYPAAQHPWMTVADKLQQQLSCTH